MKKKLTYLLLCSSLCLTHINCKKEASVTEIAPTDTIQNKFYIAGEWRVFEGTSLQNGFYNVDKNYFATTDSLGNLTLTEQYTENKVIGKYYFDSTKTNLTVLINRNDKVQQLKGTVDLFPEYSIIALDTENTTNTDRVPYFSFFKK